MGLDMYLHVRRTLYKPYGDEAQGPAREAAVLLAGALGLPASSNLDDITVEREAAYWRKANQVHGWFVANAQDGRDDCGRYAVGREQLQQLHDLCAELAGSRDSAKAAELLPPQAGFFFGGTALDEWYWHGLTSTAEQLAPLLALPDDVEFYYHSSW